MSKVRILKECPNPGCKKVDKTWRCVNIEGCERWVPVPASETKGFYHRKETILDEIKQWICS